MFSTLSIANKLRYWKYHKNKRNIFMNSCLGIPSALQIKMKHKPYEWFIDEHFSANIFLIIPLTMEMLLTSRGGSRIFEINIIEFTKNYYHGISQVLITSQKIVSNEMFCVHTLKKNVLSISKTASASSWVTYSTV